MCGDRATEVDHIIELAAGGSNTIDNVQPLCKDCHKAKTAKFNSTRKNKKNPIFSEQTPPTDSLSLISPRLIRFDPPTTERPKS
jgi:5-methylcytosine-specific restriction endonuclease McrA